MFRSVFFTCIFMLLLTAKPYAQQAGWSNAIEHWVYEQLETSDHTMDALNIEALPPDLPYLPDWNPNDLAFFCRIEHNLYKENKVRVLFRLGSIDYVNYLEQKPGYQNLNKL